MHPGGLLYDPVEELSQGAQAAARCVSVAAVGGGGQAGKLQAHQCHHCKANWEKKLKHLFSLQNLKKKKVKRKSLRSSSLINPPPLAHPCSWFLLPRRSSSRRTASGTPLPTRLTHPIDDAADDRRRCFISRFVTFSAGSWNRCRRLRQGSGIACGGQGWESVLGWKVQGEELRHCSQ